MEVKHEAYKTKNKTENEDNKEHKTDKNNMVKYKLNKTEEEKNIENLRSNLRSSMKKKSKAAKPMAVKTRKISEYMRPNPDRDTLTDSLEAKVPDTAKQGTQEQKLETLSYSMIRGERKLAEDNINLVVKSLNLPRGEYKAEL